jgi:hypothetical protein
MLPEKLLSANDNQLITELKVYDNDTVFRYSYLYDNLGNKVLETKFTQKDSTWIRKSLIEWIYDGNKCITQQEQIWNDSIWLMNYSIDYEYNHEQLISELHNIYNNGVKTSLKKIEYLYNNAILTSKNEFYWQSNTWILMIQTDYSYFQNGLTDSIKTSNFQSGLLNNQFLSTFTYNLNGTLQSQLFLEKVGINWINSDLINWFYSPNSSVILSVRNKKWMPDTSSWENTQKLDYQYNDSTELISEICQKWSSMCWTNDIKYDYLYDNSNRLIKKTLSKPIYNDWRGIISINYSNFTLNKANYIASVFEFWGGNTGELTTSYIPFIFNNELSLQKGKSIQISYLPLTDMSVFNPAYANSIQLIPVYPNPSDGLFYINSQRYTIKSWLITDLNGQIVKKQIQSFQSGVIDLSGFAKGIYILQVNTTEGQMNQKLIKE